MKAEAIASHGSRRDVVDLYVAARAYGLSPTCVEMGHAMLLEEHAHPKNPHALNSTAE